MAKLNLVTVLKMVGYENQASRQATMSLKRLEIEKSDDDMYDLEVITKTLNHITKGKGKAEFIVESGNLLANKNYLNATTPKLEEVRTAKKGQVLKTELEKHIELLEMLMRMAEVEVPKRDWKLASEKVKAND